MYQAVVREKMFSYEYESLSCLIFVITISLLFSLCIDFTPYSGVSIVDFEQVNSGWEQSLGYESKSNINILTSAVFFNRNFLMKKKSGSPLKTE